MKIWKKFSEQEIDFLKENYKKISIKEISNILHRDKKTISRKLIELKLKDPGKKCTPIQIDKELLYNLYWRENKQTTEIGKMFNCSNNAIKACLKRTGIHLKTRSQVHSGRNLSEEHRQKIGVAHLGTKHTEEHKRKIGESSKGRVFSKECLEKRSKALTGLKRTQEFCDRMSRLLKGRFIGDKSSTWKGGKSSISQKIRQNVLNEQWRKACMTRDDFTCQKCNIKGGNLQVDHIKPLSYLIIINKIETLEDAIKCPYLWDINNGRTLCVKCHKETDTYGSKANKYENLYS